MQVTLDEAELSLARFVGEERDRLGTLLRTSSIAKLPETVADHRENDVRAAAAELAVAKATGLYWHALVDDPRKHIVVADVGDTFHVKAIDKPTHNLIVRPNDPRFGTYVLCYVELPRVTFVGAFDGDAISPRHWRKNLPQPAFLIPREELSTVDGNVFRASRCPTPTGARRGRRAQPVRGASSPSA